MRILLLGYSRIAQRRVIPAIMEAVPDLSISIASRSAPIEARVEPFAWFSDYQVALERSGAEIVYISLHNSAHAEWATRALLAGLHLIVDKPAFLTLGDARRIVELARSGRRLAAEATVFAFHPQFEMLKRHTCALGEGARRVTALFSMPSLPASDFRNDPALGGGALWDLGPYAVASDRVVFGRPPDRVHAEVVSRSPGGMVTAFSVLFSHGNRGSLIGHFGFGTEYQNRLFVLGEGGSSELPRAFTTPRDKSASVVTQSNGKIVVTEVPAADSFGLFMRALVDAVQTGRIDTYAEALVADAELLDRLRRSLEDSRS